MADNSTLPVSTGTEVFKNRDVSGTKWPELIAYFGDVGAGIPIKDTPGNRLPVLATQGAGTWTVTVNGVPTTAADRGAGAASSNTMRVTIDTGQMGGLVFSSVPVISGANKIKKIAANSTDTIVQATTGGAAGDFLDHLVCVVSTPANSQVMIGDGISPNTVVLPNAIAAGISVQHVIIGARSTAGPWHVATATGVDVIAVYAGAP